MLIGLFRPRIILPDREYTDTQLRAVLQHELTHLQRTDILVQWISLLGKNNWYTLINTIYTTETIFDGILDVKMENSPAMQTTVTAILGLLRKKRILLV